LSALLTFNRRRMFSRLAARGLTVLGGFVQYARDTRANAAISLYAVVQFDLLRALFFVRKFSSGQGRRGKSDKSCVCALGSAVFEMNLCPQRNFRETTASHTHVN